MIRRNKKLSVLQPPHGGIFTDPVLIWSDGSCAPTNPGPGGWGAILRYGTFEKEIFGNEKVTTNNRMELTAAAAALETLTTSCMVVMHVDSQYVQLGITGWCQGWMRNNWRTSSGSLVANVDLWKRLINATKSHQVDWRWVKAHSGIEMNERVDRLASKARESLGT